jgi:hypothetical protein
MVSIGTRSTARPYFGPAGLLLPIIGGDSVAVIQGSDGDVPSWSTSLESPKATR